MFDRILAVSGSEGRPPLRWRLADEEQTDALFPDETAMERHCGTGEFRGMEFLHVNARSIINTVPAASRMPFKHTINAYRGCSHSCVYCFARPTHEYLGMNGAEDFERRIVVKVNAVERLRAELRSSKWKGGHIAMGTNTDPYQHAEGKYHLSQGIVKTLGEFRNPFSILTKSTLILRDLELLQEAARRTSVRCNLSIGTLDRDVWKLTEPGTPPPERRVDVVRRLNEAGIACGVLVAPVLPGLSDSDEQIGRVVEACLDAGAVSISIVGLHLRPGVREHFMAWLERERPDLVPAYRRRFARGSYQPKAEQARLAEIVSELTHGAAGRYVDGYDNRSLPDAPGQMTGRARNGGDDCRVANVAERLASEDQPSQDQPSQDQPIRGRQLRLL